MQPQRTLSLATGVILLALPLASAAWSNSGSLEPDTHYDVQGGWMHQDADQSPDATVRQVYFNVFPTNYLTGVNANAGATGSGIRQLNLVHFHANLGVWKDCNLDGYIGHAESAVDVYRAELLPAANVCAPEEGNPLAHNDGEWVWEFLAIGNRPDNNTAPMFVDEDVAVWGDIGRPGRVPGTTCPLAPLPHGTTAGSGAFIRWADCLLDFRITDTVNAVDSSGGLGLRFTCEGMSDEECQKNPQQSRSLLNQELPQSIFGNPRTKETGTLQKDPENDGEAAFTTWDCSKRGEQVRDPTAKEGERGQLSNLTIQDPTGGDLSDVFGDDNQTEVAIADESGAYAWLATPAFSPADPTWSVAAGVNQTADGVHVYVVDSELEPGLGDQECGPEGTNPYDYGHGLAFFYADGDFEGTAQAPGKNQADRDFTFYNSGNGERRVDAANATTGKRTPLHTGGVPVGPQGWLYRPGWDAGVIGVYYLPQSISEDSLQPEGGEWWTFYARVGAAAVAEHKLVLPNGDATGTYGSLNCPVIGPGAPKANGWECDPANWYLDPQGKDISEPQMQRVGALYNLMDVDCFDGRVDKDGTAYASLAPLAESGVCG